jgi:hypothetical protein
LAYGRIDEHLALPLFQKRYDLPESDHIKHATIFISPPAVTAADEVIE